MSRAYRRYRFMVMRRVSAIGIVLLFIGANAYGWVALKGNLSYADLAKNIPLADPYHLLQLLATLEVPATKFLVGSAIVLAFYAIFAGRAFCSWVCPMNIVTDAAAWIRRRLGIEESKGLSRQTRYWILGASIAMSLIVGVAAFEWISPISMLHRGLVFGMGAGWIVVLGVFLFDLLVVKYGFCGHLCPLGGFYSVTGRYSVLRPVFDMDRCTDCGKCTEICPEAQVLGLVGRNSGRVVSGECTNCGRCIEVCDDGAMNFSIDYRI